MEIERRKRFCSGRERCIEGRLEIRNILFNNSLTDNQTAFAENRRESGRESNGAEKDTRKRWVGSYSQRRGGLKINFPTFYSQWYSNKFLLHFSCWKGYRSLPKT